jgi:D-xylose transport system permease protein
VAGTEQDPRNVTPVATAPEEAAGGAEDLTAAAEVAVAEVPPEILANTLGQYLRGWLLRVRSGDSGVLPVIVGIVAIAVIFQILDHAFFGSENLVLILDYSSVFMVLAMGEIFALLLGEVDLSVGLVMALGAVLVAFFVQPPSSVPGVVSGPAWPWWLAIIASLIICALVGAIQGTLVARLKMPSLIVTLGGFLVLEGVTIIVLGGNLISIQGPNPNWVVLTRIFHGSIAPLAGWIALVVVLGLGGGYLWGRDARRRRRGLAAPPPSLTAAKILLIATAGVAVVAICNINRGHSGAVVEGVPIIIPVVLVVLALWTVLLQRTTFGRYIFAIGGNPEAARRAGIGLVSIRTWGFVLASLTAGIGGVLFASWQGELTTNIIKTGANTYTLLAIAAAVIGGTSLFGGRGKTLHGILGGLVIGMIEAGLLQMGIAQEWVEVATGAVLVAAGLVDVLARRGGRA